MLTAIVFDLDGLMVDSEPLARRAWEQAAAAYGRELSDDLYHQVIGLRLEDSSRIIRDGLNLPLEAAELAKLKSRAWERIWRQGLPVMPGLMALQEAIAARHLPWAVATSSRRAYAEGVLTQLGLREQCRAIAGGDEVARGKPAPDLYLLAAERMGVAPAQCLALEDSVPGAAAAAAAGMIVVAVPNHPYRPQDFSGAHHLFASLQEVADHLDELMAR